jgi:hypothetical protein
MLHAFRHFYAEQGTGGAQRASHSGGEEKAQGTHLFVRFAHYGVVVIELVVLLGQVVCVVRYQCGGICTSGLGHDIGQVREALDKLNLLLRG